MAEPASRPPRNSRLWLLLIAAPVIIFTWLWLRPDRGDGDMVPPPADPAPTISVEPAPAPPAPPVPPPVVEPAPPTDEQLAYIDTALGTLSRWQAAEIRPLLATTTNAAVDDAQLQEVLGVLQRELGELVNYEPPSAVALQLPPSADADPLALHSFRLLAHYREGDALVSLVLQQTQDTFSLYHFDIQVQRG